MAFFPNTQVLNQFEYELRSRYSETDKMGYVYYGHYLQYFEVARTEMVRSVGYTYAELENAGFMLPVVKAELEYKSPVFYDELIRITVKLYERPNVKLDTYYEVTSVESGQIKVLGRVLLVFMDAQKRKAIRGPENFISSLLSP